MLKHRCSDYAVEHSVVEGKFMAIAEEIYGGV
jgi:hypothetical protein